MFEDELQQVFDDTLANEGKEITVYQSGEKLTVFFRRSKSSGAKNDSHTIFYPLGFPLHSGSLFKIKDEIWMCENQHTVENDVYMKSSIVKCNGTINSLNLVRDLPFYCSAVSIGADSNKYMSWISGKAELLTEDCPKSRALKINDSFNEWGRSWKIENIFYIDGICHIMAVVQADTDIDYDYDISFLGLPAVAGVGDSFDLQAAGTINGTKIDDAVLSFTSSDESVATVSNDGVVSFVGLGPVSITIRWDEHNVSVSTTETNIEEESTDIYVLNVERIDTLYLGNKNEIHYSVTLDEEDVTAWVPIVFSVEDCAFATKLHVSVGDHVAFVDVPEDFSLNKKTLSLCARSYEYGIEDIQTMKIRTIL